MPRSSLRLLPLAPAVAALVTVTALLWLLLPAFLQRNSAVQLLDEARLLTTVIEERVSPDLQASDLEASQRQASSLQLWVRRLAAASEVRITVISFDGTVLADSDRSQEQVAVMDNHAGRPEVQTARRTGEGWAVRRSDTTRRSYVYAARTFTTAGGERYFLRLAQPLGFLRQLRYRLLGAVLPSVAAALVVMALVSLWLDRKISRPLMALITGAGRLADGHYTARFEQPEDEQLRGLAQALNRLAARVEEEVGAVAAERDHLRTILARMSEGVLVVDPEGRAVLANPAFRRLFSLAGEVAGRAPVEITRQPQLTQLVERTLASGEGATAELALQLPERRTLQLASASLGRRAGAVVVARDTTAFTRLAAMRRDFVANVSHELKTPLSAIRGYAETLRDGALEDPDTARRFTHRILAQCHRLQALLEDLLILSRLESVDSESELPLAPMALAPVLALAAEVVVETAREKGVELTVEKGEPVPRVRGHGESLERLVVNLLDNAVKYNRPGGRVTARLTPGDGTVILEVTDTGIGIPADSLPRIFERFYRVDKGRSRAEGGTGLGLAIVKHIAQLHGGRVEVESTERKGSTFRVHLPSA